MSGVGECILRPKGFEEPMLKHKKIPRGSNMPRQIIFCFGAVLTVPWAGPRGHRTPAPWWRELCRTAQSSLWGLPRVISLQIHLISASRVSGLCYISLPDYSWRVNISLVYIVSLIGNTLRQSASAIVNVLLLCRHDTFLLLDICGRW